MHYANLVNSEALLYSVIVHYAIEGLSPTTIAHCRDSVSSLPSCSQTLRKLPLDTAQCEFQVINEVALSPLCSSIAQSLFLVVVCFL